MSRKQSHLTFVPSLTSPKTANTNPRITHFVVLDFLRFMMASCVVLFHYEIFIAPNVPANERLFGAFDASVDFFFILSGFIISHNYGGKLSNTSDYARYLKRRLARIYPLHIATLFAFIVATALAPLLSVSITNIGKYDFSQVPAQLFLVHAWGISDQLSFNHISWSISAELFLYIVFPIVFATIHRLDLWKSTAILACTIAALSALTTLAVQPHWLNRTYDFGILRALPSFALGIIIWHAWKKFSDRVTISWVWPTTLIAFAMGLMLFQANREFMLAVFALAILATGFAETTNPCRASLRAIMKDLGDASYGLYMLHILVGIAVFKVIVPRVDVLSDKPIAAATLAFILSLIAARISYRSFESPMRKYISAIQLSDLDQRTQTMGAKR